MSQKVQHIYASRENYDKLTAETIDNNAIYFVGEADNSVTLYKGSSIVSSGFTVVNDINADDNLLAGRVYYDKGTSGLYYTVSETDGSVTAIGLLDFASDVYSTYEQDSWDDAANASQVPTVKAVDQAIDTAISIALTGNANAAEILYFATEDALKNETGIETNTLAVANDTRGIYVFSGTAWERVSYSFDLDGESAKFSIDTDGAVSIDLSLSDDATSISKISLTAAASAGTSTELARADHVHALDEALVSSISSIGVISSAFNSFVEETFNPFSTTVTNSFTSIGSDISSINTLLTWSTLTVG